MFSLCQPAFPGDPAHRLEILTLASMLGKLLKAWLPPGAARAAPVADMMLADDLPADLPAAVRASLADACAAAAAGRVAAAARSLWRACEANPGAPLPAALAAWLATCTHAADATDLTARARALDAALDVDDRVAQYFYARGVAAINRLDDRAARRCLSFAAFLSPQDWPPQEMLGIVGYLTGDIEEGRGCFDRAIALADRGEQGRLRLSRLLHTIPQIAASVDHLAGERTWFENELARLEADPPHVADPMAALRVTPFYLAYQGLDNRALLSRMAQLLLSVSPQLAYRAAHVTAAGTRLPGRLRVAIVSVHLGRHSVGHWYRALVGALFDDPRLEITLYTGGAGIDERLAAAAGAAHRVLPGDLTAARAAIEAACPDILVYTDVGIDPLMYLLAFSRLAAVQALLVGHPDTSGIPTIDHFVSNVHQDLATAQSGYSERLVRFAQIPVLVEKTAPPALPQTREQLGMAAAVRYYLCPMMLQKMHPDFDPALARILRRDPQGEVLLFADAKKALWQSRLEERFARVMPDIAERIMFRPYAARDEFLSLLMAADCVLDPFHFSGGVTTYIALSLGVPVVTMAGLLFRSRMTAGIYAQAGIEGLTAQSSEEYVELALAMAGEPGRREAAGRRILAAHGAIFGTRSAAVELADWINFVGQPLLLA